MPETPHLIVCSHASSTSASYQNRKPRHMLSSRAVRTIGVVCTPNYIEQRVVALTFWGVPPFNMYVVEMKNAMEK